MLYEQLQHEYANIESQLASIQKQIASLPPGKLICAKNGKHYKWYQSDGHTSVYLPKKCRSTAEKLAYKKYLSQQQTELLRTQKALRAYLDHDSPHNSTDFFAKHPELNSLLASHLKPISQELADWTTADYESNPNFPQHLTLKSISGHFVRSKSESLIDMLLFTKQIPFRCECALKLGEVTIYPDFTIRHPRTGKYYYWEHFGLADDYRYGQNICSKLQLYISNDLIPSIHLITTFETKESPLSVDTIQKIINEYFL